MARKNMPVSVEDRRAVAARALRAALPHTIPIMAGFLFLGLTYGIYVTASGFAFWVPTIIALTVFAGSVEFVAVEFLLGPFAPLQAFLMTVIINARHLFYGVSMLDRYGARGWKKAYLIFGMCDETFSINYSTRAPVGVDEGWFFLWITLLNHTYWVTGATLGGAFGSMLPFNMEGLEFVLTAMFVVIFMDQWMKERNHASSLLGLLATLVSLLVFGAESFIIPAMVCILGALTLARKPLERRVDAQ